MTDDERAQSLAEFIVVGTSAALPCCGTFAVLHMNIAPSPQSDILESFEDEHISSLQLVAYGIAVFAVILLPSCCFAFTAPKEKRD